MTAPVATIKGQNMFLGRISLLSAAKVEGGAAQNKRHTLRRPRETKKVIACAHLLLSSSSNKRKLHTSPIGSWIDLVEMSSTDECDSDISDSDNDGDDDLDDELMFRETRWSSTPSLANALFFKASAKPLTRTVSVDTPMILPARKRSFGDFKNLLS